MWAVLPSSEGEMSHGVQDHQQSGHLTGRRPTTPTQVLQFKCERPVEGGGEK